MFDLRTLRDEDFLVLDWRAGARIRFAMAKTPIFSVKGMAPQGAMRVPASLPRR
jgi:hypothetical protein